jgi:hypothetical protein
LIDYIYFVHIWRVTFYKWNYQNRINDQTKNKDMQLEQIYI